MRPAQRTVARPRPARSPRRCAAGFEAGRTPRAGRRRGGGGGGGRLVVWPLCSDAPPSALAPAPAAAPGADAQAAVPTPAPHTASAAPVCAQHRGASRVVGARTRTCTRTSDHLVNAGPPGVATFGAGIHRSAAGTIPHMVKPDWAKWTGGIYSNFPRGALRAHIFGSFMRLLDELPPFFRRVLFARPISKVPPRFYPTPNIPARDPGTLGKVWTLDSRSQKAIRGGVGLWPGGWPDRYKGERGAERSELTHVDASVRDDADGAGQRCRCAAGRIGAVRAGRGGPRVALQLGGDTPRTNVCHRVRCDAHDGPLFAMDDYEHPVQKMTPESLKYRTISVLVTVRGIDKRTRWDSCVGWGSAGPACPLSAKLCAGFSENLRC
eukprot:gene20804-biopygen20627